MLIYRDTVNAWNGVDVEVDGGQLQHGNVIGVVEKGLLIDFQCGNQRSQFVEYERNIFHYSEYERAPVQCPTARAQVLSRRQLQTDGPWLWYEASVIPNVCTSYDNDALFVELQLPQGVGTVHELLPFQQVRAPPTDAHLNKRRVEKGQFVQRCCPLPTAFWSAAMPQLGTVFNRELGERHRVVFVARLKQTLLYLQRAYNKDQLDAEKLEKVCQLATNAAEGSGTTSRLPAVRAQPMMAMTDHVGSGSGSGGRKRRRGVDSGAGCLQLPAEVLLEVFRTLDSIERVRCRRTCGLWNGLLTTEAHFPEVRVSGEIEDYGDQGVFGEESMYWAMACILKCLHRRTKALVISNRQLGGYAQLFEAVQHRLQNGRRLPLVVFFGCVFGCDRLSLPDMMELEAGVVRKCPGQRVVWKECRLFDGFLQAAIAYHEFDVQGQSAEQMEMQLWDVFEGNLVVEEPLDLPALQAMIAAAHPPAGICQLSAKRVFILGQGQYQDADPRPTTTHYRDWHWRLDAMAGVDVRKLTKLTAAFLAKVYSDPQSDEWDG
ncbi:uncharacterized protein LOC129583100 [Paramacrobiotus metropolitanus]|uniref:uncharacterized protein LOC129583100 n=1 Tax=Paramacrobiotus metropolitanus TaxID=2943436 RepID=UPI002445FAB2|nr:uncharacterized protein LOC129583100 [Paramacrobiotus metropolitanus]